MAYNFSIFYLLSYRMMRLSLIITTYNWPEALLLVLKSIECQTILPDEVIIADDGSTFDTCNLIKKFKKGSNLNIVHSWHEDYGFRVARSRNKAISKSSGEYLVLIDGDSILHPQFIKDHLYISEPGYFVQGSRVLVSFQATKNALEQKNIFFPFFTSGLKNRKNAIRSKLLSKLFSRNEKRLQGIKSCNMAFFKKDFIKINGFNNDFEGWGREDSEFVVRLINSGIKRKNIRFSAVQFHLWHNENSRKSLEKNDAKLDDAINKSMKWCENGFNSMKKNED